MGAMHDVVKAGKARYIGACSMHAWQFLKYQHGAELNGWTKFASIESQINLVYREEEREMLPLCSNDGIAVIPWRPLAAGKVTRPWGTNTDRSATEALNKDGRSRALAAWKDATGAIDGSTILPPKRAGPTFALPRPIESGLLNEQAPMVRPRRLQAKCEARLFRTPSRSTSSP